MHSVNTSIPYLNLNDAYNLTNISKCFSKTMFLRLQWRSRHWKTAILPFHSSNRSESLENIWRGRTCMHTIIIHWCGSWLSGFRLDLHSSTLRTPFEREDYPLNRSSTFFHWVRVLSLNRVSRFHRMYPCLRFGTSRHNRRIELSYIRQVECCGVQDRR